MEEKQLTSKELEEQANALLAETDFEEIKLPKKAKKAAAAKKAAEEAAQPEKPAEKFPLFQTVWTAFSKFIVPGLSAFIQEPFGKFNFNLLLFPVFFAVSSRLGPTSPVRFQKSNFCSIFS